MTDQPSQPPQRLLTKAGKNEPYPVVPGPSGQTFQVMSLALECNPGLHVGPAVLDEDDPAPGPETHQINSGNVEFQATVQFTGGAGWKIGWVQTAESGDFWVLYKKDKRAARHRRILQRRMKDGDSKGCWYGDEARAKADPDAAVTVKMSDDPNFSFCFPRHPGGPGLDDLKGFTPTEFGGTKEFWAWLVAVREDDDQPAEDSDDQPAENGDDQPPEMVFLHYIHWHVVYDCQLLRGIGLRLKVPATSGAFLLGEGAGQGSATPVLTGPPPTSRHEDNKVEPQ